MSITKSADSLLKMAARWHDFIASMSPAEVARIREAGLMKPLDVVIQGINKGTDNILKRYGFQIKRPLTPDGGDKEWFLAGIRPEKKFIDGNWRMPPELQGDREAGELFRALSDRHEAYEAAAFGRAAKKFSRNPDKEAKRISDRINWLENIDIVTPEIVKKHIDRNGFYKVPVQAAVKRPANFVTTMPGNTFNGGKHMDMSVLTEERKLMDRIPQQDNPGLQFMRDMRNETGETQYLDLIGGYKPAPVYTQPITPPASKYMENSFWDKIKNRIKLMFGRFPELRPHYLVYPEGYNQPVFRERFNKRNANKAMKNSSIKTYLGQDNFNEPVYMERLPAWADRNQVTR